MRRPSLSFSPIPSHTSNIRTPADHVLAWHARMPAYTMKVEIDRCTGRADGQDAPLASFAARSSSIDRSTTNSIEYYHPRGEVLYEAARSGCFVAGSFAGRLLGWSCRHGI